MAGVNRATIIGNLGKDPEIKAFQDGSSVANFSVATSETWNDKNTGEKKEKTEWHRIVAFRRLAEICGQHLVKGKQVYIEGKIQTREWTNKEGNKRNTTEIIANNIQMLGNRQDGGYQGGGGHNQPGNQPSGGDVPQRSTGDVPGVASTAGGSSFNNRGAGGGGYNGGYSAGYNPPAADRLSNQADDIPF